MAVADAFKKKPRFADDAVVIAWQAFSCDVEEHGRIRPYNVTRGTRLRGNHPAVRSNPQYFVVDGTPEGEWPSHFAASDPVIAAGETAAAAERARLRGPEIPLEHQLEVVIGFRGPDGSHGIGEIVDRRDPKIKKVIASNPQVFNVPSRPIA